MILCKANEVNMLQSVKFEVVREKNPLSCPSTKKKKKSFINHFVLLISQQRSSVFFECHYLSFF